MKTPRASGRWSLRQRLAQVLVLTALLPALLFGGALLYNQWQAEHASMRVRLDANVRMAADAMDDFLQARLSGVDLSAGQIADGAPAANSLASLLRAYPQLTVAAYVDARGEVVAARDRGGPLHAAPAFVRSRGWTAAHENAQPAISGVIEGTGGDGPLVALSAPVWRDGGPRGRVVALLPVVYLVGGASEQLQRRGFELLVLDRDGRVLHATPQVRSSPDMSRQAALLRDLTEPSAGGAGVRVVDGILEADGPAYVDTVAMRAGWTVALLLPRQHLLQPLLPRLWMLGALLAITSLGVAWSLWRQRRLLGDSIGYLLASLRGYALGGRIDGSQAHNMPLELQPLARGIGDLGSRMNAAFIELRQVLAEREHVIEERTDALRQAVAQLDHLSRTDALTGGLNYRGFKEAGDALFAQARAEGKPLCVLALDIDHFKAYNDRYGHLAGDGALRRFAGAVRSALLHADDVLARPGGEEFIVFLPATTQAQAREVARRVVARVRDAAILHEASPSGLLSVSVGVAAMEPGDADVEDVLARADASMYAAKSGGRDRVGD